MSLAQLSASFQSLPPLPTRKLGLSGADSCVRGFVYVLGPCGSFQQTQPLQVFSVRGFEALFPHAGTLDFEICLTPQLFLPVCPHTNVGLPALSAATSPARVLQLPCLESPPPQLPNSFPPTGLMDISSLTPWLSDFHTV
ncbi:hypothetical protein HJG60_011989 [Phyllostomus discolor]|uniref:Uncharacterized protein n=1 Tax=Phyllostomus discolor TaxID=89673 RepID=A0A834DW52_9CHIR|nr:hypothetical protein HJG60_011989 [Phyllostomus discolor]